MPYVRMLTGTYCPEVAGRDVLVEMSELEAQDAVRRGKAKVVKIAQLVRREEGPTPAQKEPKPDA